MPIVHVYTSESDRQVIRAIADGVHQAMVETIGIPVEDRFQVIHRLEKEDLLFHPDFLGVERSDDFLIVEITLAAGRTVEIKERLYQRMATLLATAGRRPADLFVSLHEVGIADFSLGMGEAQFVRSLPPHLRTLQQ